MTHNEHTHDTPDALMASRLDALARAERAEPDAGFEARLTAATVGRLRAAPVMAIAHAPDEVGSVRPAGRHRAGGGWRAGLRVAAVLGLAAVAGTAILGRLGGEPGAPPVVASLADVSDEDLSLVFDDRAMTVLFSEADALAESVRSLDEDDVLGGAL
ncbi:MAG: hypothetical protein SFY69_10715 [Planctomycetota bacterium]|nr:hypothetical protein [Planctomycetota bacterium]